MSKKKSFLNLSNREGSANPADQFISSIPNRGDDAAAPQAREPSAPSQAIPSSGSHGGGILSLARAKPETKSKRFQLLIRPSLYDRSKAAADKARISFNEIVHIALERLLENIEK